MGKSAGEIIYAFTLDPSTSPYLVLHDETPQILDITFNMSDFNAIMIYDAAQLDRREKNEYWFKTSPKPAALLLFSLVQR